MCGISGIIGESPASARPILERMLKMQHRRGPDARGSAFAHGAALGHNRLSIIDLSEAANQPMIRGHLHLVYNGELYNFRELRTELEQLGAQFTTSSDTEVVLRAFEHWGETCVARFNGMFAFAIWDEVAERLFLARDRTGEKPLFYGYTPTGFVFASEPGAVATHPALGRRLDPEGLATYLALGYTTGEATLFAGIKRLPPATYAWFEPGTALACTRYWDLAAAFANKRTDTDPATLAGELTDLIDDAVRIRMIADVPLGAFLSGGLDSSAIAAAMVRAEPSTRTFSIGFASATFDERRYAREVAEALNVQHTERVHEGFDLDAMLCEAAREPLADSSFLPMLLLAETTRASVTVALSGDGADEALLGYPTHVADALHHHVAPLLRPVQGLLRAIVERLPTRFSKVSFDYRARQWTSGIALDPVAAHYHWREILSHDERARLIPDLAGDATALGIFRKRAAEVADCHFLDQASYVDLTTWLPDDILVKVDRSTMAHSLEARAPFLDHRLLEYAASLPVRLKYRHGLGKRILRESQRDRLPAVTLRRAKRGFNAPVSEWLNTDLKDTSDTLLNDPRLLEIADRREIMRLLDEHRREYRDHGLKLLNLMTLALWLNGGETVAKQ